MLYLAFKTKLGDSFRFIEKLEGDNLADTFILKLEALFAAPGQCSMKRPWASGGTGFIGTVKDFSSGTPGTMVLCLAPRFMGFLQVASERPEYTRPLMKYWKRYNRLRKPSS